MAKGIKEVAKEAGVSIATASRALNNEKYVSEESLHRVLEAAKKLNYEPNRLAKSLLKQKTNIIGIVVSDIDTSFFSKILKSIEKSAYERNYSIMICNIDEDLEKEKKYLSVFKQLCVDGIIMTYESSDKELEEQMKAMANIPMVCCSCTIKNMEFPSVNIDDYKAAYDAIKYLYKLGHRKIAYLGASLDNYTVGVMRHNGVLAAFEDLKIAAEDYSIGLLGLKIEHGYKMMKQLIKESRGNMPTAIFAGSDDAAVGAINCLVDYGYNVPEDVSVLGFDNSAISVALRPSVSTVHQPIEEVGYISVNLLIDLIEKKRQAISNQVVLPHRIIERDSCLKV